MRVEIKGLNFAYRKERKTISDLSLSLNEGEFVSLLGCNGAGKTTLFKLILGFLKPDGGTIEFDGVKLENHSAKEIAQKVAYIPQLAFSTFDYTVFNTVLMGTTAQISTLSSPGKKEEERVWEMLEKLNITNLAERKINEISGGERQLALIARALSQNAKILILDEITANLDYGNTISVLEIIKDLSRQGYTILLSTHNPETALFYADRIMLLEHGAISFSGTPGQLAKEDRLSRLYGKPLFVKEIEVDGRLRYVCLPR
jgi:ABC-type cobalamin/Fe3+-siderophores transport systems, ATPase components